MKFILIPDSFKGTLSSSQICAVMDEKIKKHFPDSLTVSIPVADGGEGSVDAFITAVGGVKEYVTVKNPYFEDMESYFGLIDAGQTAVIEMASCAGLPLVEDRKDPRLTTTYGVGQLILAAARKGVKKIIVGLGGSSTNDGGCGAAAPDFHRYVVKVPSNALHKTFPKKVLTIAPRSSGTTIKPPGIFLTACKIFILNVPPVRLL